MAANNPNQAAKNPKQDPNNLSEADKDRKQFNRFMTYAIIGVIVLLIIILGTTIYLINNPTILKTLPPIQGAAPLIGLVIILGVSVLLILLFIMSVGFNMMDLSDKTESLALPAGSVRALIALLLIVIWVIASIFLFTGIINIDNTKNGDAIKLGQQFYTTMSTLVVAIAAFYFGSSTQKSTQKEQPSEPTKPVILSVSPSHGKQGETVHLTIVGKNFGTPQAVRLTRDRETAIEIKKDIILKQTEVSTIECTLSLAGTPGAWDVVVVNFDGKDIKRPGAFEIEAPATGQPPTPTVTKIDPNSGPTNGGDVVTITGKGFTGASSVSFGTISIPASDFKSVSDTEIKVASPNVTGTDIVHVTVKTPGGISTPTPSDADQFTYK